MTLMLYGCCGLFEAELDGDVNDAGALKDVQEMKESLQQVQCPSPSRPHHSCRPQSHNARPEQIAAVETNFTTVESFTMCSHVQVFAAEDPETTTDEEEAMPEAQRGAPGGASEAERRAVLERLQGQDNHLAAGFKVRLYHPNVQDCCPPLLWRLHYIITAGCRTY